MILYHGQNRINNLKPILHHMIYHQNEKCILVGDFNENYKKFNNVTNIIRSQYIPGDKFNESILKNLDVEKFIFDYYDYEFEKNNINLNDIKEFYVGSCWTKFPSYLSHKKIRYNFFEESPGNLNNSDNVYVLKKYCTISAVRDNNIDKTTLIDFDITKEINKLSDIQKKEIIDFFNVPTKLTGNFDVLLLTQWWQSSVQLRYKSDDVFYRYGLLFDYYVPGQKIYIKPHPADVLSSMYTEYFTDCEIEKASYVSELMGLIPDISFKKAITISSTSLSTVGEFCDELIEIGFEYKDLHHKIIKFDIAIELSNLLCEFNFNIIKYGIHSSVFPFLFKNIKNGNCSKYNQIVISDEFYLKKHIRKDKFGLELKSTEDEIFMKKYGTIEKFVAATENTNNCFIITHNFEEIFDKVIRDANNIIVIKISKEKVKEICAADLQNEYIYVYCKNIDIRNKVQEFIFEKHLFQTGINITAKPMSLAETQMHYETIAVLSKQIVMTNKINNLQQNLNKTKKENEVYSNEITEINKKYVALTNNLNKIFEKYDSKIENLVNKSQVLEQNLKERSDELYKSNTEVRELKDKLEAIESSQAYKLGKTLTFTTKK